MYFKWTLFCRHTGEKDKVAGLLPQLFNGFTVPAHTGQHPVAHVLYPAGSIFPWSAPNRRPDDFRRKRRLREGRQVWKASAAILASGRQKNSLLANSQALSYKERGGEKTPPLGWLSDHFYFYGLALCLFFFRDLDFKHPVMIAGFQSFGVHGLWQV